MKAVLKYIHSPDIIDLENGSPNDLYNFGVLIQAVIGPSNSKGEESFDFIVCTPNWVESEIDEKGFLFGKDYIFVKKYDYRQIKRIIQDLCDRTFGDDWETIANKIGHYGAWEFEDYQTS